jgi:GntR family transcriptional regulator, histidine utilization repressor
MTLPLYSQVKDHVLAQIRSGALPAGARVPSENDLVGHFRISRMTANRALRELAADGYLNRVPGVGTFVKQPQARASLMELRDIAEEIALRGHRHTADVLVSGIIDTPPELSGDFGEAKRLFHLVLRHRENGQPVQLEDRYASPQAVPEFLAQDYTQTTPAAWLAATLPADELEHTVEAALPAANEQRWLNMAAHEPCLKLYRRGWSGGVHVTTVTLTYPASRYALHSRYSLGGHSRITS